MKNRRMMDLIIFFILITHYKMISFVIQITKSSSLKNSISKGTHITIWGLIGLVIFLMLIVAAIVSCCKRRHRKNDVIVSII